MRELPQTLDLAAPLGGILQRDQLAVADLTSAARGLT
jgi:hypothetical protein